MSRPEPQRQSRSNHFDSESGEYDVDREPLDDSEPYHPDGGSSSSTSSKEEWIAFGILLDSSTRYCPHCLKADDEERPLEDKEHTAREHELDDKVIELPYTALKWTCRKCGCQCFGGIVPDRSLEAFDEVLSEVLDAIGHVPDSRRRELRAEALARKRRGVDDRSNLSELLAEL